MKICVVVPAYNEEVAVASVVRGVLAGGLDVVVIDDGSADRTSESARGAGAFVIRNEGNKGKGAALLQGFGYALEHGYDAVITMDADGQHLPSDLERFVARARGNAQLVIGDRMQTPQRMPLTRKLTNRLMSWVISRMARCRIPDTQCGFRLIGAGVLRAVHLTTSNYELESEILIKAARQGFRIESVPVTTVYGNEKSSIHPLRDTFRFLRLLRDQLFWRGNDNRA